MMSSQATPIQGSRPVTPPLNSAGSPRSPSSTVPASSTLQTQRPLAFPHERLPHPQPSAHTQNQDLLSVFNILCFAARVTPPPPSFPPLDSTSSMMSSQATPIQGSRPVTPPLNSAGSPRSPSSTESLHPPPCRHRDRSPSPMRGYLIPSPLPTRRTRTCSATARASEGPLFHGVCKCFSRSKGHGFITPSDGGKDIFVHISDIEGEYVPIEGDEVSYKLCSIPPKHEKVQAVEVTITHLKPGTKHETWAGRVVSS